MGAELGNRKSAHGFSHVHAVVFQFYVRGRDITIGPRIQVASVIQIKKLSSFIEPRLQKYSTLVPHYLLHKKLGNNSGT